MLNDTVQGLFRRNMTDYQKEINLFVLKVCFSGGILGVLFFCALKLLGVLDRLEWISIANFAVMSVINLSIPMLFYFLVVRRSEKTISVKIFKYILITCAGVNYLALISFVPYYEMWGSVFLVFFLSSFYLEINCVIYSIALSIAICLIAILSGNPYFLPQTDTYRELLIRGLGFSFGAVCSFITAVLSKKLLMRSSRSEFESSLALHDLESVVNKATEISGKLSEAGISISSMARQQNAASEEIAHKSSDVLAEAAATAQNVDRSAELIQKLVNDIRFNMRKVSEMEASSRRLQEVANEGKSSINDAVEKIEGIKESVSMSADSTSELNQKANEIDAIVAYIRQIADQTNMLSLNASIEAARAGEQGKGFAVVADEIRKLAEQSHQSLKTISGTLGEILSQSQKVNQMMEESVTRVEAGVEIVRQSDATYQKIADTLSGTLRLLSEISMLSESQIRESGSLNEFIHEVHNTAQNTSQSVEVVAASTEESFAASEELIKSANLINDLATELLVTVKKERETN